MSARAAVLDAVIAYIPHISRADNIRSLAEAVALLQGTAQSVTHVDVTNK